jgi:hypothetical protein
MMMMRIAMILAVVVDVLMCPSRLVLESIGVWMFLGVGCLWVLNYMVDQLSKWRARQQKGEQGCEYFMKNDGGLTSEAFFA